jgi:L-malate glycosyltransferase
MSSTPPAIKVLMLGPANVGHTQRWIEGLHARGVQLVLASQHVDDVWQPPAGVVLARLPYTGASGYFRNVPALRRLLQRERPDLLHAHYASGYGTTAALAGFHPWLLSVWGSDVFDFPYEGRLKGWWLRRNLRRADALASTSHTMALQVQRLAPELRQIAITPFGVDTERFAPAPPRARDGGAVVIGTVKTLAPKYGIDVLLRAFAALPAGINASLLIVGDGPQRAELQTLAASLGIAQRVSFVGAVPHAEVPSWLQRMDIYVAVSRLDSESFGVAVLEASACGLPVVVSDAGGLPEVVVDGQTGIVVPREDAAALTQALQTLIADPERCRRLGNAGRERAVSTYRWSHSVDQMLAVYASVRRQGKANLETAR